MKSIIDHINQSRLGYARQIVDDAIRECKPNINPECEQVQRIRSRIATYIQVAMMSGGLDEPDLGEDVAGSPPAADPREPLKVTPAPEPAADPADEPAPEPEKAPQAPADEAPEGGVILEKNRPPRLPKKKS